MESVISIEVNSILFSPVTTTDYSLQVNFYSNHFYESLEIIPMSRIILLRAQMCTHKFWKLSINMKQLLSMFYKLFWKQMIIVYPSRTIFFLDNYVHGLIVIFVEHPMVIDVWKRYCCLCE